MKKNLILAGASLMMFAGCATKNFVIEEVAKLETQTKLDVDTAIKSMNSQINKLKDFVQTSLENQNKNNSKTRTKLVKTINIELSKMNTQFKAGEKSRSEIQAMYKTLKVLFNDIKISLTLYNEGIEKQRSGVNGIMSAFDKASGKNESKIKKSNKK